MDNLTQIKTMSSREIAERTGKRHSDVLEAIRAMEPAWEKVNGRKFPLVEYTDAKGEKRPIYQLSKTECLYVATKFNDEARAKLILRWEELESQKATSLEDILGNPDRLIGLATELKKERSEKLQLQEQNHLQVMELKKAAPKVEYYEEVLNSEATIITNVIAKELGMSAVTLNRMLHEKGVIYKSGETWVLYHQYQNKGFAKTKTHTYTDAYGQTKTSIQLVWTERGREFIHSLMNARAKNTMRVSA